MGEILERQQAPTRHRLDVGAYYKMAEVGILTQHDRVELIGGEIFDMTPIGSAHAGMTNRLNRLFARASANGLALVSVQSPLRLDTCNEPEPDVMLSSPGRTIIRAAIRALPTSFYSSNSPKARSSMTAGASFRSTQSSACRKSGLSICGARRSRSTASRRAPPTP